SDGGALEQLGHQMNEALTRGGSLGKMDHWLLLTNESRNTGPGLMLHCNISLLDLHFNDI
ncbi:MAG TPA: hypothetical protein VJL82_01230, partial [Rhizomicrobium sp.]|nr:hypothetical protein [Rhizomicrobium sp.]